VAEPFRFTVTGRVGYRGGPDTPLLYALRNELGLKGTRFGCGTGQCGACFVLIDGHPAPACDTPLWSIAGKRVTTVEGLDCRAACIPSRKPFSQNKRPVRLLHQRRADQRCGALSKNPRPSENEVRAALDRNLCRCGSHNRMVRAVMRVAAGDLA